MAKKSSAQATVEAIMQEDLVFFDEDREAAIDLSYWEIVNPSDADSDDESLHSLENGFVSWCPLNAVSPPKSPPVTHIVSTHQDFVVGHPNSHHHGDEVDDGYGKCHPCHAKSGAFPHMGHHYDDGEVSFGDDGYASYDQCRVKFGTSARMGHRYDDDDDEEEDGYGLDDELVPWNFRGKLGRERMRKLGKRVCAKMSGTRHNAYRFVKPGCVYGKHGWGFKA